MIVDGKHIAEDVLGALAAAGGLAGAKLGLVMAGGNAATESFVRIKERAAARLGVEVVREVLPEGAATADAVAAVRKLSEICGGVIVQLPLPETIDTEAVLSAIPKEKDLDAVNPTVADEERLAMAPVAGAIAEILSRAQVEVSGKKAAVVGAGRLVGRPAAHLLQKFGAEVSILRDGESLSPLAEADIIVSGAGKPGLIKPEHIKEGTALIDAGTSESEGKLAGDADPSCADKCAVFTPVPGGVGPVAVAMIFKNLAALIS